MSLKIKLDVQRPGFDLEVDCEFPSQGVTALFGPSGCGKTTALRVIAGLDQYSSAEVNFNGQRWQSAEQFIPSHQRSIGYVFQEASLFPHLSVEENIDYAVKRTPAGEQRIDKEAAIDMLGVAPFMPKHPQQLSGGERQRVAIARALAMSPKLLLMDEPLSALDNHSKAQIFPYLEALQAELKIPIIYVSHAIQEVCRLSDYLVLMDEGKISKHGQIEQILTDLDSPLALIDEAQAVVEASVVGFDAAYGLNYFDTPVGRFTVPGTQLAIGRKLRLRIAARDVSLTIEPQTGTSILNILPATISEILSESVAQMIIKLQVNDAPILARVTKKSAASLALRPGKTVYAQIKSVAVL